MVTEAGFAAGPPRMTSPCSAGHCTALLLSQEWPAAAPDGPCQLRRTYNDGRQWISVGTLQMPHGAQCCPAIDKAVQCTIIQFTQNLLSDIICESKHGFGSPQRLQLQMGLLDCHERSMSLHGGRPCGRCAAGRTGPRTCPKVVLAEGTRAALKDSRLLAEAPTSSSSPWSRYMCPHAAMLAPCMRAMHSPCPHVLFCPKCWLQVHGLMILDVPSQHASYILHRGKHSQQRCCWFRTGLSRAASDDRAREAGGPSTDTWPFWP